MNRSLLQLLFLLSFTRGILSAIVTRRIVPAPFEQGGENSTPIDHEYIVLLHENHTLENHFNFIGTNFFNHSNFKHLKNINVYRVGLDNDTLLHDVIRFDPGVKVVQQNGVYSGLEKRIPTETSSSNLKSRLSRIFRRWQVSQTVLPWNLLMLASWGKLPTPVEDDTAQILSGAGTGVNVYVLDSGVRIAHPIFQVGGAAINFNDARKTVYCGIYEQMDDLTGHGTHVAGIVKQNSLGATIVNVKALCGPNRWLTFGLIDGSSIFYVLLSMMWSFSITITKLPPGWRGSVINMSFQGPEASTPFDIAIAKAITAGIVVVTSAGNSGLPTATSPCGLPSVICVGGTNRYYGRPDWTNYGPNLTIWAPGDSINSSTINPAFPYLPVSGTSEASPHVAGVVANFIAFENLQSDVATVLSRLNQNAQSGVLSRFMGAGSPDLLANYGLANPNRNPQFPYAGPQKELAKVAIQDSSASSFVLDDSGAAATVTSAPFPVMDPPSASTNVNFEGPLPSEGPETVTSVSSEVASIASEAASALSGLIPVLTGAPTATEGVSSTQFALEPSGCSEPCT